MDNWKIIFLFLNENIYCDVSLEPSRRDGSNDGLRKCFYGVIWLMVLGKLPVPVPTNLDYNMARAYLQSVRVGLFGHFLSSIFYILSPPLWEMAWYRLKYCLKELFTPKQPTNLLIWSTDMYAPIICNPSYARAVKPKTNNQPTNLLIWSIDIYAPVICNPS